MHILGFDYPDDCHYLLENDMWCRQQEDGLVQVGVTAFGVHLSDDFYMCRPKRIGTVLTQGETVAIAELSKMVVAIKSPVSGMVEEINLLLEDKPGIINKDPYGQGWLVSIRPTRWEQDLLKLSFGTALRTDAETRMRLEDRDFPPE